MKKMNNIISKHIKKISAKRREEINKKILDSMVKVNCKNDLIKALMPFKKDSKSELRKLIIDGFDIVKKRIEYYNKAMELDKNGSYGGIKPLIIDVDKAFCWVDKLIEERLDGKREGLTVIWNLNDGKYVFDPYTGTIKEPNVTS